jgi:hypothetical protein
MPVVVVYSRPGCHLCERLVEELAPRIRGRARLEVRDIDTEALWQQQFGTRIPVVEIDGAAICEGRLDADALERALLDAISGRGSHHS